MGWSEARIRAYKRYVQNDKLRIETYKKEIEKRKLQIESYEDSIRTTEKSMYKTIAELYEQGVMYE
jgi:hypothetical protein